jgi:3-oxoacyl-(acyl-carrier-protein) synthase/acyl carrier protein
LEDAGYTRSSLAERYDGRVGVFAGIAHAEFNVLGPEQWRQGKRIYPRTSFGSVANRVSFLFNLNGPSMPVDTMCSSALTAIHEACESILRGESALAIAGAVNLCLHPSTYVALCASRLLSRTPKCNSFGLGDDGYVPGEGVGVVILKRLSEAVRDRDRIHAIIRGTAVNHGGRTNGYTVPNPNAQAQVIRLALDNAGVDARAVTYVEAHGAGTKLGDPIEVLGLTRAFRHDTEESGFCALGSVKSNVGHLEAAAGMAGLTKVILQMQHRQLVPNLHAATLNPEIKFAETPFVVQQTLGPWERPVIMADGTARMHPRIAGISAFGAGGANAHLIVEEYEDDRPACDGRLTPCLVILSARNPDRLKEAALALRRFLGENSELCLADVAYTLQVGREAMEERLGCIAESLPDLANRLTAFLEGWPDGCLRGSSRGGKAAAERFLDDADLGGLVTQWIEAGDHAKILEAWVSGHAVDWRRLYPADPPRRIGLPTYPFAKERYWLSGPTQPKPRDPAPRPSDPPGGQAASWVLFREQWEATPQELDLRAGLARYAGTRIAVVAEDPAEGDALVQLLHRLEAESSLARPLRVSTLLPDSETTLLEPPEVVLFLGPKREARSSVVPCEKTISAVFHLSRKLMNACWGEPVAIFYLYDGGDGAPRADCEALSGFVRSARKENEQHVWSLISNDGREPNQSRPQLLLREWLLGLSRGGEVRYEAGQRLVRKLVEISLPPKGRSPFREKGNYLLAGGMGYLGRQLSLELARRYQATLVLLTRGELDESRLAHCRALEALGARVVPKSVDITNSEQLEAVYRDIGREVGALHGVFHLARQHEDQMIARKTWASFARVIRPKVHGMLHLDGLTRNEPLDFFAVFSSLGAYGVRGSSDYSYATAFQNAFSNLRNRWVTEGKRSGVTVSLCWGPWLEDHLFPASRARLVAAGFGLIDMESGFPVLESALAGVVSPLGLVRAGDEMKVRGLIGLAPTDQAGHEAAGAASLDQLLNDWEKLRAQGEDVSGAVAERITPETLDRLPEDQVQRVYRLLFGANGSSNLPAGPAAPVASTPPNPGAGVDEVVTVVRTALADVLQLTEIDDERSFLDYGLDSIAGMKLAVRLEKRLRREVAPQSLISFPTVAALARHLHL